MEAKSLDEQTSLFPFLKETRVSKEASRKRSWSHRLQATAVAQKGLMGDAAA